MINQKKDYNASLYITVAHRRGIVIPIIIGILTIFFILLMAIGQGSTELGRNMSLINHRQHARFMALAAIEEMHNIVWNKVSNPINASGTRNDVIQAVTGGGEFELDLRNELKHSNELYTNQKKIGAQTKGKAVISIFEAKVKFHNFKPIVYSSTQIYSNPNPYYRSPDGGVGGIPAGGPQGTHQDFYGWVTYTVKAQHGIVTKQMKQSRPIKIVDMTPMGREYALFEMESASGASLDEGPGFYIDANDVGRIRMDGPYYIDVEGGNNGLALSWGNRSEATGGLSYPKWSQNEWDDDSYVPSPKWVTTCPGWASLGGHGGKRLILPTGFSTSIMYAVCLCCPALLPLPVDIIAQQMQPNNQQYISAKVRKGNQTFSLTGRNGNEKFKGLLYADQAGYEAVQGISEDWDPDKGFEVRHEGLIIGTFKSYNSTLTKFCIPIPMTPIVTCNWVWFTKDGPEFQQIYAYKGDEEPEIDWMGTLIGAAFDIGSGLIATNGLSKVGEVGFNLATFAPIMKGIGHQLMGQAAGFLGGGLDPGAVPTPQQITNAFPSGFRMSHRGAVRHFATLDEALWKSNQLLLDGVLWIDDLNSKARKIDYTGKGTIAYFGTQFSKEQIIPEIIAADDKKDFLNVWFYGGPNKAFLRTEAEYLQFSLYASDGLNPKKPVTLVGNYMTSTIRKPELDNDIDLIYWFKKLHDTTKEEFQKDFRIISMSPKVEAISEVTFNLNRGAGEDGVEIILGELE